MAPRQLKQPIGAAHPDLSLKLDLPRQSFQPLQKTSVAEMIYKLLDRIGKERR